MTASETELIEKLYAALRVADDQVDVYGGYLLHKKDEEIVETAFDAYEAWNEPRIEAFISRQKEESHG